MASIAMNANEQEECICLLDACTPQLYRQNAFRITGLLVDSSTREIKRRIDDLKNAAECGNAREEHSHAFALDPTPSIDLIREAAQQLQDPERRIVNEVFWFWPAKWGEGRSDQHLSALGNGDKDTAFKGWASALKNGPGSAAVIAKHNMAVMYHLVALDSEHLAVHNDLTSDQHQAIAKYWGFALKWWEDLTNDETFWSLIAERIRILDDPRLTTGFARRMRSTFPQALDRVNAMLALAFFEKGKHDLGRTHVTYMLQTHQGQDDVARTLAVVTAPLKARVVNAVESAREAAQRDPRKAAQSARDMLDAVAETLKIIRAILPAANHERIDLCDSVADACLTCQIAYARETRDWVTSTEILAAAEKIAESLETQTRIQDQRTLVKSASLMDPLFKECEQTAKVVEKDPADGEKAAQRLLSVAQPMLSQLGGLGVPAASRDRARDEVAGTVMHCAVAFGNKTEKWEPCIALLDASLRLVASPALKDRILKNLQTVRQNQKFFSNLKPISSAPSLSTVNGIGCTLYGCTDKDPESGSYLATYYFVLFAIPVFPICRYRVISTGGGYRFLGKAPLRTFDKWHLFVSLGLIAWCALALIYESSSTNSSPVTRPSARPDYSSRQSGQTVSYPRRDPNRSNLAAAIDAGKARAKTLESRIEDLDSRLENMKRRMDSYRTSDMVDEYNALVPQFNALVGQRNDVHEEYSQTIDDVNAKVSRYNSGY